MESKSAADTASSELFRQRIAQALPSANIPTLLLLLYQFTGDDYWIKAPFEPKKSRWDDNDSGGLAPALQGEVREAALEAIVAWREGARIARADLTAEELIQMMTFSEAEPIPPEYGDMIV